MSLLLGTHERLGQDSPVQTLSALPAQLVVKFLYQSECLLELMLNDHYRYHNRYPTDEQEYQQFIEVMKQIYLDHPSKSSAARLDAYWQGTQPDFMELPAQLITCPHCDLKSYQLGDASSPNSICSYCQHDHVIIQAINVWEIPVYVDVDTFYWTEIEPEI